jgi:hypothetical protein
MHPHTWTVWGARSQGILLDSDHQPFVTMDTKLTLMMSLIMAITMTLSAVSSLQPFGMDRVMLVRLR